MSHALRTQWASPPGTASGVLATLRDALHAEWTKLRTTAGTAWLLLGTVVVTVGVSAAAVAATRCPAATACPVDTPKLSLTGIQVGQVLVAILAVQAISGEYSTGMIRITLTAMPRRASVLAAKAAMLTGLVLAAGIVAVAGALLAGRLILPGHGFTAARGFPPLSLGDGPVLRAAAGSVLYLALIALLSLGIATAVRDSAAAIGLVLGLFYLVPRSSPRSPSTTCSGSGTSSRSARRPPAWPSRPPPACAACPSARGPASACSPPGPRPPCWAAACSCGYATPERAGP